MIETTVIQSGDRFKHAAIGSPQERVEQRLWIENALAQFTCASPDLMDALSLDADVAANGDELDRRERGDG